MFDVMEGIINCPLKCFPCIIQTKREFLVSECDPWINKSSFRLVLWVDIDLIIAEKTIHEREYFTYGTCINNLVDKWSRIIVFLTSLINIPIIDAHLYCPLFLHDRNNIGNQINKRNRVNETILQKFFDFYFKMNRTEVLSHWFDIKIHFDFMFNYTRANS